MIKQIMNSREDYMPLTPHSSIIVLFRFALCAFFFSSMCFAETPTSVPTRTLTLSDCYQLALGASETLKQREVEIGIAEAQYQHAVALLLPSISFSATQRLRGSSSFGSLHRNNGSSGTIDDGSGNPSNGSGSRLGRNQVEGVFTLRQPIFNGFQDYFVKNSLKATQAALTLDRDREQETLYLNVADLYFQVRMYSEDLKLLRETESTLEARVDELKKFITLGKSKESERLAAEADQSQLRATEENVRGLLNASQELLSFFINVPSQNFVVGNEPALSNPEELQYYLTKSMVRSDLKATEERVTAAEQQAKATSRERWPSLALEANGYAFEDPDRNRDWEVLFRFDVPLYEGGGLDARVAEQRLREHHARLILSERKRLIERDVRVAFSNLTASLKQLDKIRQAAIVAKKSYESQSDDYTLGRVTNLEVLQAIRQVLEARRAVLDAETKVSQSYVELEVISGGPNL